MAIDKNRVGQVYSRAANLQSNLELGFAALEISRSAEAAKVYSEAVAAETNRDYRQALDHYLQYQRLTCHEDQVPQGLWNKIESLKYKLSPSQKSIPELSSEEVGARYDELLKAQKYDYHLLSIKAAEIQRWDQELKSNTLPHKRRQLLSERVQTLHRESEALRRNIDELGRQRLALWNQREDLRKVIQAGHDDYHLEAWNLTYANSRAKISADEYHDQLETVIQASIDAEVAPVSINTMNLHSNWLNQKGWDSIRELNGSEFIVAKKANCQPDYDIPEQLNEDGLVIVIYKAAWCAMPCDIEIEGFKALQKDFPALRIAVMLVYSEDEAGLAELQRVRGHQNMLDIDLLAGHGKDESGYSRVGMRAFPTTRIYNNKIRASEHQGAFIIQDPEGRLVFDRKRAIAFLNSVFESKVESK